MLEPTVSPRLSVVALAATLLVFGPVMVGCRGEDAPPAPSSEPATLPSPTAAVASPPVLDRAGLLQAMDVAASAYAAGREIDGASLAGRRFVVRQAFGCAGPMPPPTEAATGNGLAAWSWGDDRQSLKLTLAPGDWTGSPQVTGGPDTWEAVEGFWLTRPWLREEGCPAVPGGAPASGAAGTSIQSVGLAAVFEEDGARTGRRNGRAYDFTVRGEGSEPPPAPSRGYRLVLEGRMAAFADGQAIRCSAASPEQRPVCIGAVQLDRVAFEDAQEAVLSEWRGG